jgi:formylglycine-generating enzyme required for sulfatase activity
MTLLLRPDIVRNDRPSEDSRTADMVWIPGGTFRMGSDKHYPEEAPAHLVTVDGFWIVRTPANNRQFTRFVIATGHKTTAEISPGGAPCGGDRYLDQSPRVPMREEDCSNGTIASPHSVEGALHA